MIEEASSYMMSLMNIMRNMVLKDSFQLQENSNRMEWWRERIEQCKKWPKLC